MYIEVRLKHSGTEDLARPSAKPIIIYPEAYPAEARARSRPGARFRRMNPKTC